jgi:hypothetical protein
VTPNFSSRRSPVFLPTFTAALILVKAIVGLPISTASQGNAVPDCLNSDGFGGTFLLADHTECKDDVFKVSQDVDVQKVEKMFGVTPNEVTFIGCAAAPFQTKMVRTDPPFHFLILYRVSVDSKSHGYQAPIFHELGHVYQLSKAGSPQKLFQSLYGSNERVELGADFLAGLAAQRLKMNQGTFQTSLFLTGSYDSQKPDSHGCPEARSSAFRYGYHAPVTKSFDDAQYADFQDNEFAVIKHSGVPQCSN